MKVLVTGGAGYIGSVCVELLIKEGHEVVVFDNLERGHKEALHPEAKFVKGDLRCKDDIFNALDENPSDVVMHFAAYALVGESMAQPEIYFRNNVIGGINLAEAMYKNSVNKIVFSSTCATYGQPEIIPIAENTPQSPTNPYGESKLMFEQTLNWYRKLHGFKTIFLRYFNVCGASERCGEDHAVESHLIPLVLQVALGQREKIFIYGDDYNTSDGTCVRDYVHVQDLIDAHIRALSLDDSNIFNLGVGNGFSVKEVIEAAREVTGHPIPAEMAPRRAGDPDKLIAASGKAQEVLGWKPKFTDMNDVVASAWQWHQAHPNGY
ncbi:MAG: UDP-glucose 4-epimerase GalE [Kiritimatiellae bacterium]|nr:UDP-glucose 4-epimerase GalE [Kiritimatiellia bacterium]